MVTIEDKIQMIKQGIMINPFFVELHLTNACNHACKWCITKDIRANNISISYEKAINLIDDFKKIDCESVWIPMMKHHIVMYIDQLQNVILFLLYMIL